MSIRMGLNWVFLLYVGRGNVRWFSFSSSLISGVTLLYIIAFGGVMASMVLCCVNTVRDSIFFLSNPSPGGMDPNALT